MFLHSSTDLNTLRAFRYRQRFVAERGGDGAGGLKHGKKGSDLVIEVPVGTEVWTLGPNPVLLVDLRNPSQRVRVAKGGRGGRGNASFVTSTNRFPLLAEEGEAGENVRLRLEMKLLADVGIVGAPNTGKSSLLVAASRARTKIADYPFTTLEPVLGVVTHHDREVVMVDIPGIIDGAHEGVGLGLQFLRHVDRTRTLVHLVDGSVEHPWDQWRQVNHEMKQFDGGILDKPQIVAVNKIDIPEVRQRVAAMKEWVSPLGVTPLFISAATGEGVKELLDAVMCMLNEKRVFMEGDHGNQQQADLPILTPRPGGDRAQVYKDKETYVVAMDAAARIGATINANDWNAMIQFFGQLKRMGVIRALEDSGIASGDTVRIGKLEWEWE